MDEKCLAQAPLGGSRLTTRTHYGYEHCETETVWGSSHGMTDPGRTHSKPRPKSFGKGVAGNRKQLLACGFAQEKTDK